MLILGIDPGVNGAMALYNTESKSLIGAENFPTETVTVNKTDRKRIHWKRLGEEISFAANVLGCRVAVIEDVGGAPGQAGTASFTFGYTTGRIHGALEHAGLTVVKVTPAVWKMKLRVPGKGKLSSPDYKKAIMDKAEELFPDNKKLFRGPKGGVLLDVAEAALIAYYFSTIKQQE